MSADMPDMVPIDAAARDGSCCLVNAGDEYAAAYWTGSIWAYQRVGEDQAVEQIDFDPTRYKPHVTTNPLFLRFALREVEEGEE